MKSINSKKTRTLPLIIGYSLWFYSCISLSSSEPFYWPNDVKAAVSLSYDDALNSQLDNAIPALEQHGFKGTFYLVLSSDNVVNKLAQWRAIAARGHELGNHTINHHCRGSQPNRAWVKPENDLDKRTLKSIINEITNANRFLTFIDGHTTRTFSVPCTDNIVEGKDYLLEIEQYFVGIKSHVGNAPNSMDNFNIFRTPVYAPSNVTGAELIAYVDSAATAGTIANITFHGIGGDHLSVSREAHAQLLEYLAHHKATFWVDTYQNISTYVNTHKD
ncbi:MAG: peptidoglycan/xylan/chitin deacetylase (PgdA/CDA1 family) [Alteromonadaceae bacterium]|jgi:peptidoglycan/xylan/chitin deacetylase (PgdA/CDA1 family)